MRTIALALILTATSIVGGTQPVRASEPVDAEYVGVTTDLADFKLVVRGVITTLEVGAPTASFPLSCFDSGTITLPDPIEIANNTIRGGEAVREITDPVTGERRRLQLSGRVFGWESWEHGIAKGSLSISAWVRNMEGDTCTPRSFGWVVAAPTDERLPFPGTSYRGRVQAGQSPEGLGDGGSFSVTEDAMAITNLRLATPQECSATDLRDATAVLANNHASFDEEGNVSTAIPTVSKFRVVVSGDRALGVFYIDRGLRGCRPLGGFFVATTYAFDAESTATNITDRLGNDGSSTAD